MFGFRQGIQVEELTKRFVCIVLLSHYRTWFYRLFFVAYFVRNSSTYKSRH